MWCVSLSNTALSRLRFRDLFFVEAGAWEGVEVDEVVIGEATDLKGEEDPPCIVQVPGFKYFNFLTLHHDGS